VSKEAPVAIVGATLIREGLLQSLPPDHQKALLETGKTAHDVLMKQVPQEDARAYQTLTTKLGLKEFTTEGTPEQKKAWATVYEKLQKNLTGRLWSKELYAKVTTAAAKAKK
jgi:TRAP-type C4-dicarboxylate transport system substrate-binding protein